MAIRLPTVLELRNKMNINRDEFEEDVIYWTSNEQTENGFETAAAIYFNLETNMNFDESNYDKRIGYEKDEVRAMSKYIIVNNEVDKESFVWIDANNLAVNQSINWYDSINEINEFSNDN